MRECGASGRMDACRMVPGIGKDRLREHQAYYPSTTLIPPRDTDKSADWHSAAKLCYSPDGGRDWVRPPGAAVLAATTRGTLQS
jgi:hypothetical protein